MRLSTRLLQTTAAVAVAGAALAGAIGPASAATASPPAGVYSGNQCLDARWYVDNAGAEACVYLNGLSSSSANLAAGAFDYARDGYSAKTDVTIQQYTPGVGWQSTHTLPAVVNSSGYGTTKVGGRYSVPRVSGATSFRLWIRACTYDSPTKVHKSCGAITTAGYSW